MIISLKLIGLFCCNNPIVDLRWQQIGEKLREIWKYIECRESERALPILVIFENKFEQHCIIN